MVPRRPALLALAPLLPGCLLGWTPPVRYAGVDGTFAIPADALEFATPRHADLLDDDLWVFAFEHDATGEKLHAWMTLGVGADGALDHLDECENVHDLGLASPAAGGAFTWEPEDLAFLTLTPTAPEPAVLGQVQLYVEFDRDAQRMTYLELAGEIDVDAFDPGNGESLCETFDLECGGCAESDAQTCLVLDLWDTIVGRPPLVDPPVLDPDATVPGTCAP